MAAKNAHFEPTQEEAVVANMPNVSRLAWSVAMRFDFSRAFRRAAYGTARDFAKLLGWNDVAQLLQETLDEEEAADKKLTALSKRVNKQARTAEAA